MNTLAELKECIMPVLRDQMRLKFDDYHSEFPEEFENAVIENVYETSAWQDEGYFSDGDVSLAIQRIVWDCVMEHVNGKE